MVKKKQNKQALVPELRFPEFQDEGEWEERPLGDFLNEHKAKSDGQCEVHSVSVHKGVINRHPDRRDRVSMQI
jgi:type I restriction enzyme S subunit